MFVQSSHWMPAIYDRPLRPLHNVQLRGDRIYAFGAAGLHALHPAGRRNVLRQIFGIHYLSHLKKQLKHFTCVDQVCSDTNSYSLDNSQAIAATPETKLDTSCSIDFLTIEGRIPIVTSTFMFYYTQLI